VVGADIPAGRCRMISDGTPCYWQRLPGFTGEPGDWIVDDLTDNPLAVTIAASDVGSFADADCATWSKIGW